MSALAPERDDNPGNWELEQILLWDDAVDALEPDEKVRTLWLATGMIAIAGGMRTGQSGDSLVYVVDRFMSVGKRRLEVTYRMLGQPLTLPLLDGKVHFARDASPRQRFALCASVRLVLGTTTFTAEGSDQARQAILDASGETDGDVDSNALVKKWPERGVWFLKHLTTCDEHINERA